MEILQRPEYLAQVQHYFGKETIIVLTGQRRVGKSYVLMALRDLLLEADGNVIYINKEKKEWDDIVTYKDLNEYIEGKYVPDKRNYILIDEVQEIKEFEKSVRHWRTEPHTDLVLTGSNAETLSSDLSTLLAARYHEVYIQALTYKDFIRFHKLEEGDDTLSLFITAGGLPGLVKYDIHDENEVYSYAQDVLNTALVKDIILKHKIRNVPFLYNLVRFLADSTGKPVSATSISNYMKGQKSPVSIELVLKYLKYLCDAYIVTEVPRFDIRGKKLLQTNSKYYFEDNGIRNSCLDTNRDRDIEKVIESIIYHQLIHDGYKVNVGQLLAGEVDFVCVKDKHRVYIQASYIIGNDETRKREFGALKGIADNYPKYVISMTPLVTRTDDEGIQHISLREFLKNGL
ncbi:MAG: ATP-binding protein [Bacteroidales bacterium]|nr:ATP-binding protein [Bacteroidales bacterium]MBQ4012614.1 ATP-binding protein [Bacteroidales bacterium]